MYWSLLGLNSVNSALPVQTSVTSDYVRRYRGAVVSTVDFQLDNLKFGG